MGQDADIAKILSMLGVPRDQSDAARLAASSRHFDLETDEDVVRVSRIQARLLLFLEAQLQEWLNGGDPAGSESDLRWSIVSSDGMDWMEVRVGERTPMRFGRGVAAASITRRDELRQFANGRS